MSDFEHGDDTDSVADEIERAETGIDQVGKSHKFYDEVWESKRPHRRGVIALVILGTLGLAGGFMLPEARSVLFALGGIGIFGAVILQYLLPARFISAATSESIYTSYSTTCAELVAELQLHDERIYIPNTTEDAPTRLFVPAGTKSQIPVPGEAKSLFVYGEDNQFDGISVLPTGWSLYREFEKSIQPDIAEQPSQLAEQIADALTNHFGLVDKATTEGGLGYVAFTVIDTAYGPVDRFDHPVESFLAVTLASVLEVPVGVTVTAGEGAKSVRILCSWNEQQATAPSA